MKIKQWLRQSALGLLAASGIAVVGGTAIAQTTDGFTIFGGVDSEFRLSYQIDNNEERSTRARYYLWVSGRKVSREVLELQIAYPEEFEDEGGYFTNASIELREGNNLRGPSIAIEEVIVNSEDNVIEIYPEEPLPARSGFTVVMSRVRNPNSYGNHYFTLDVMYQGGVVPDFVGIWPLEVASGERLDRSD